MKKFIVVMSVLAFSALAFGDEAPTTTAPTGDAAKTADTTKPADAMAGKKTAKKAKHGKKAKKAATDDKAM